MLVGVFKWNFKPPTKCRIHVGLISPRFRPYAWSNKSL